MRQTAEWRARRPDKERYPQDSYYECGYDWRGQRHDIGGSGIMSDFALRGAELARARFEESARVKRALAEGSAELVARAAELVFECLREGRKVLVCGNGGSAADAQHIAGELVGRYLRERRALPAIALTTDTSILTAIGNDYAFEVVFSRQVEALGAPGDVLIGITTSGNSPDVLRAVEAAQRIGLRTIGLTGQSGGKLAGLADLCIRVPSAETPRIQEAHIAIAHVVCELVEEAIVEAEGG